RRIRNVRPVRLRHLQPATIRLQAPLEQPLWFVLARGDEPHGVFAESGRNGVSSNVRNEPVLILSCDEGVYAGSHLLAGECDRAVRPASGRRCSADFWCCVPFMTARFLLLPAVRDARGVIV